MDQSCICMLWNKIEGLKPVEGGTEPTRRPMFYGFLQPIRGICSATLWKQHCMRYDYLPPPHLTNKTKKTLTCEEDSEAITMATGGGEEEGQIQSDPRKPRILCLHGFRTSAKILRSQIERWPESVLRRLDLLFLDGPYPALGKSSVEGVFDPPYFEWFQANQVSF